MQQGGPPAHDRLCCLASPCGRSCSSRSSRERTITVDCDVIQANGRTRPAVITGGYVALADAVQQLRESGKLLGEPVRDLFAASVGIVLGTPVVDLDYQEDSTAEVDMNVVMTGAERFVEVQGTAERTAFDQAQLDTLLGLGRQGVARLLAFQRRARRPDDGRIHAAVTAPPRVGPGARGGGGAVRPCGRCGLLRDDRLDPPVLRPPGRVVRPVGLPVRDDGPRLAEPFDRDPIGL